MSQEIDIKDYQQRLLTILHAHGTPEDWVLANAALEHVLDAAAARNPALDAVYHRDILGWVRPNAPTPAPASTTRD